MPTESKTQPWKELLCRTPKAAHMEIAQQDNVMQHVSTPNIRNNDSTLTSRARGPGGLPMAALGLLTPA